MIYKKQQFGTFNLHTIKTDKFKLCHVEIYFRNNVNVNDITKRNALFDVLFENNNEFKSRRLLNLKLEELYDMLLFHMKAMYHYFNNDCKNLTIDVNIGNSKHSENK